MGKMGMFQATLIKGDLANREELISFALSFSSPRGLVRFRWRIFFQLPYQEKEGKFPIKAALLRGFSELLLLGVFFSHWMVLLLLLSMSCTLQRCTHK